MRAVATLEMWDICPNITLFSSAQGDSMELETWCLEMNEKWVILMQVADLILHFILGGWMLNVNQWFGFRCEKDIKVSYTVYTRLSLLLKSLLAITRVTPAYKLSRKQGHDYVILYRYEACTHTLEHFWCLFAHFLQLKFSTTLVRSLI